MKPGNFAFKRSIWSLSLLLFMGLIMYSIPVKAQCTGTCVQITSIRANGQTFDPTQPLTIHAGTTLQLNAIEYMLSDSNADALAAANGRLDYAYSYAFPVIKGAAREVPAFIQVTPSDLAAKPLQPGTATMSLTVGDPWLIGEGWDRIVVLFLHYNQQTGLEEVVGRLDIPLAVQPASPPLTSTMHSALWLWQEIFITDPEMRDQLLDEVALAGIDTIYAHAFGVVQDNPSALADFIHAAGGHDIAIETLAGDPLWSLSPYYGDALAFVDNIIAFTQNNRARSPLAIHFDVEPHVLEAWSADINSSANHDIARQYLGLLYSIRNRIDTSKLGLQLNVDITFWYDEIVFSHNGITQSFTEHILDVVDGVTIMAYRDRVDGANGVIALAENEVNLAAAAGRQVFVGLETNTGVEDFLTFCEEGTVALAVARATIDDAFRVNHVYEGTAIHDYLGLMGLDDCAANSIAANN